MVSEEVEVGVASARCSAAVLCAVWSLGFCIEC